MANSNIAVTSQAVTPSNPANQQQLIEYYSQAGPDYGAWSDAFNMHFGYFSLGMNPFNLELMLERMNQEVLKRLALNKQSTASLLDIGCGLGATARAAARVLPNGRVTGLSIVPWQIEQARALASAHSQRLEFILADFSNTHLAAQTYDGAYAIESSCHAPGRDKKALLKEIYRLLKPGARLVIADGFSKGSQPFNRLLNSIYRKICDCWVIEDFAEINCFHRYLQQLGFCNIKIEDISWHIAPSIAYTPFIACQYLFRELLVKRSTMNQQRWNHIIAPVLMPLLGLAKKRFAYYIVSAQKPLHADKNKALV